MFNIAKLFALLVLFSLMVNSNVKAAQQLTCATTHYPPYTTFDKATNTFIGSDITLLQMLFERINLEVKIVNLPWARLKKEIKKNSYDCYFSLGKFPHREKYLDYTSTPTHITRIAVFTPKNNKKLDLSKKVVGVHRGINFHLDITDLHQLENATFKKLPSNDILFKMLSHQRLDAVITSKVVGEYVLKLHHPEFVANITDITNYQLPTYIAFKKQTIDISMVNNALLEIKATHPQLFEK